MVTSGLLFLATPDIDGLFKTILVLVFVCPAFPLGDTFGFGDKAAAGRLRPLEAHGFALPLGNGTVDFDFALATGFAFGFEAAETGDGTLFRLPSALKQSYLFVAEDSADISPTRRGPILYILETGSELNSRKALWPPATVAGGSLTPVVLARKSSSKYNTVTVCV